MYLHRHVHKHVCMQVYMYMYAYSPVNLPISFAYILTCTGTQVDGWDIRGPSMDHLVDLLLGEEGSPVCMCLCASSCIHVCEEIYLSLFNAHPGVYARIQTRMHTNAHMH